MELPRTLAVYPLDYIRRGRDLSRNRNPSARFYGITYKQGPDGRRDGSTQFYGRSNSYVEIPNTGKLDARYSITVCIWVYHEGRRGIILNYNPNRRGFQLRMISPRVLQVIIVRRTKRTTITVQTGGRIINYKAWTYIAVTFDERSQMLTIWVNSKPVVRRTIGKVQLDTRKAIILGGQKGSREYFRGRLFCLQLYSVALNRKQIEETKKRCFRKGNASVFDFSPYLSFSFKDYAPRHYSCFTIHFHLLFVNNQSK